MVVTRQDRVVIYQMEEREVEHTWSVETESFFADQITFFDCSFLRYVDSSSESVGAAMATLGRYH